MKLLINNIKTGIRLIYKNEIYVVLSHNFIKPGKGKAFNRLRLKNIKNGKIINKTIKSCSEFKIAKIKEIKCKYIYNENKNWFFFNLYNNEKFSIKDSFLNKYKKFIVKSEHYNFVFLEKKPILFFLPKFLKFKVINNYICSNSLLNSNFYKMVKLSTGLIVKVPKFIKIGDFIKLDTKSKKYISRENI
ncbi:MAG: hypothetical protein ACG0KC_00145 [Enterobacteriaceae bacterium]